MNAALQYLKSREWSMGNGQCPDCCGVPASWHGHPLYMTAEKIGHQAECNLAVALLQLGETPLMKGAFKSNAKFEHYISETGFYGTRLKTADGCPRYKAEAEKMREAWDEAVYLAMRV